MIDKDKYDRLVSVLKSEIDNRHGKLNKNYRDRLNSEIRFFKTRPSLISDALNFFDLREKIGGKGKINKPNSLIFYVLGVTEKEPDLSRDFRFDYVVRQDSRRTSPPDIDIDFESRDIILNFLCEQYGEERVALIGTSISFKPKAAVQMAAKALDITKTQRFGDRGFSSENDQQAKRISKIMPNVPNISLSQWLGEDEKFKPPNSNIEEAMNLLKEEEKRYPEVFNHAKKLEGKIKAYGTHAAGVVVSRDPLVKDVPLHWTKFVTYSELDYYLDNPSGTDSKIANLPSTQFDMEEVEELGLLKFDFLQLENLRQMTLAEHLIEECSYKGKSEIEFDLENLETNDPKVFKTISDLKLEGLFQISGNAFRSGFFQEKNWETGEYIYKDDGTPKMRWRKGPMEIMGCDDFSDIVASNAIVRPGPLKSKVHYDYVRGKKKPETVEYSNQRLKPILEPTYGVLVYQEQLISMAQALAGFTFSEADKLRKACAKKKMDLLGEIEPKFREGCFKNQVPPTVTDAMWDICIKFGEYAFNKSHSTAYAYITYQTAFLKTYFPTEFICAVLSSAVSNETKLEALSKSFKEEYKELKIHPPDINKSKNTYVPCGNMEIVAPFVSIKGLGEKVSHNLVVNQSYSSIHDFVMKNTLNQSNVETLIAYRVFREFGSDEEVFSEFKKSQLIKKRVMKNVSSSKKPMPKTGDLF